MNNKIELKNFLMILYKWKWHLVIILGLTIVVASIFTSNYFIKPLYKSEAIAYPANLFPYSDESETEQMLQFINANDIRDSIVVKYDLIKHYNIDPKSPFVKSYLNATWSDLVNISKTPYDAVKIEVRDTDPVMAYNICSDIIVFYNKKLNALQDEKGIESLKVIERQLLDKGSEIDSLKYLYKNMCSDFQLTEYQNNGNSIFNFFDYEKPTYLSNWERDESYRSTVGSRSGVGFNVNNQIRTNSSYTFKGNISRNFDDFKVLNELIQGYTLLYVKYKDEYDFAEKKINKNFSYANIVNYPEMADKKCYPLRFVIISLVTLGVMFLSLFVIFCIERRKGLSIY